MLTASPISFFTEDLERIMTTVLVCPDRQKGLSFRKVLIVYPRCGSQCERVENLCGLFDPCRA
jgi:hypothetical protein